MSPDSAVLTAADVRRVYTRLAPVYDFWAQRSEARARAAGLDTMAVRDGERILEVGVGTGLGFEALVRANPGGVTEGIDLTEAMLARARRRVDGCSGRWGLRLGDATDLDFPDAAFDLVTSAYVFDLLSVEDAQRALREMHRVLVPGGRLVLVDMTTGGGLLDRLWSSLHRADPALVGGCRAVEMQPHVQAAGFEVLARHVVSQWGIRSEILLARRAASTP